MRVIARRTLREFVDSLAGHKDQPAVKAAVEAWFDEVSKAQWSNSADVKRRYATASIVNNERIVWIKWIGTHRAYDLIDVTEVKHGS
jgi:mRNA interferase HigB